MRRERGATLAALAETTGISVSTLSRLESGQRHPTSELLLPIVQAHQVPLEDLVGAPPVGDPRVRSEPRRIGPNLTALALTRQPGGLQAYKLLLTPSNAEPAPQTHEGYDWLYVISGRLRLVLAEHDLVMPAGEAAEFDARVPHWFGCADGKPVELLSVFGRQGERMHLRARSKG